MPDQYGEYNKSDIGNLCVGVIANTDPKTGRVQVSFDADTDDDDDESPAVLVSDWIPFIVRKSQNCKDTFPFDIGEQVVCLMDEYWEDGVVLGATYNDVDSPDGPGDDIYRIKYKDGSFEQFDRSNGNREWFYQGEWKLHNNGGVDFETSSGKFKMANTSTDLKTILKTIVNKIIASTYTNGAGVTGGPNNTADFTTLLTTIDNLFS